MKNKLFLLVTMLLFAVLLLAACGTGTPKKEETNAGTSTSADAPEEQGTFTIGLEAAYPPFNWTQMDDSNDGVKIEGNAEFAGGYDVEMAKKVAEGLGKELKIVKIEWDGLVPALTSGKIDAIMAGMSPTKDRLKTIDFTEDYYTSHYVMVVKKGSKYEEATSIQDFGGAKITGQLNTSHYKVIDQIKGVDKQSASADFTAMRVALEAGMIDGYVSERPEGISASAANENFAMVEFEDGFEADPEDTAVAVGLVKNSDLTEKINEILEGISEEERTEIMDNAIKNQPAAK